MCLNILDLRAYLKIEKTNDLYFFAQLLFYQVKVISPRASEYIWVLWSEIVTSLNSY